MKLLNLFFICCVFAFCNTIPALNFEIIKKGEGEAPTLLLIGGIQGDEPGGFNATNIFLRHYKITKGSVWVVPVLNKHSMLLNHRGIYNDMNRKFASLSPNDPEYGLIESIKALITNPEVDAILHLHDGSGFYRPTYINANMNPNRWGSCSIIDQEILPNAKFPNLGSMVTNIINYINLHLIKPKHKYYKRDTQTAKGDVEMEKALTFFAIRHNKAAFANEASKNLPLEERVYYHLLALEGIMKEIGITYQKDFTLNPKRLYYLINNQTLTAKLENIITLPVYGLKNELHYFPLPNKDVFEIQMDSNAHIIGLYPRNNQIILKYGNKLITKLNPQYFDFDYSLEQVTIKADGIKKEVPIGSIVDVNKTFEILGDKSYRVNIIGFVSPNDKSQKPNESNIKISLKNCQKKFSIDKKGRIYRAEFYKDDKFSGMLLFRFK